MAEESAREFLRRFQELQAMHRWLLRREVVTVVVLTACVALNLYLGAWAGFPVAVLNIGSAIFSALVLRRIVLWAIGRRNDLRRLEGLAEAARAYLAQ